MNWRTRCLLLWFATTCVMLSAAVVARGQVVFTEVMYNPGGIDRLWGTGKLNGGIEIFFQPRRWPKSAKKNLTYGSTQARFRGVGVLSRETILRRGLLTGIDIPAVKLAQHGQSSG